MRRLAKCSEAIADLLPWLALVALASGVVASGVGLIYTGHPDVGWSDQVVLDAKALATGHLPYGDPAHGYVGLLYTPLYTGILALLLRLSWWEGWGPAVSLSSVAVSLVFLGKLVYRLQPDRRVSTVPLAAMLAFPLLCFTLFPTNGVFEARPDQLAWCLLIVAACRSLEDLTRAKPRFPGDRALTGLLLAFSVLTKQTTFVPCVATAVVCAVASMRLRDSGARRSRVAYIPVEFVTFAVIVGASLALFEVVSGGFALDLLFGLPQRHARLLALRTAFRGDLEILAIPVVLSLLVSASSLLSVVRDPDLGSRAEPQAGDAPMNLGRLTCVLVLSSAAVIAIATIPGALVAQAKQGGDTNQLAGPVWGMSLMIGAAFVVARRGWQLPIARLAGILMVLTSIAPANQLLHDEGLSAPKLVLHHEWTGVPRDLVDANDRGQVVFDWSYPSYSITKEDPDAPAVGVTPDLTAAGYTPRWFIQNLLDGKYDLVRPYDSSWEPYASAFGRRDAGFLWKVNYILQAGYERVEGMRGEIIFYRPTERLRKVGWLRDCFGPYRAGRLTIDVHSGGGLWCAARDTLALRASPSQMSELILSTETTASFAVRLGAPGVLSLQSVGADRDPVGRGVEVQYAGEGGASRVSGCGRGLSSVSLAGRLTVVIEPERVGISCSDADGRLVVRLGGVASDADARMSLTATVASQVTLDDFSSDRVAVRPRTYSPMPSDL